MTFPMKLLIQVLLISACCTFYSCGPSEAEQKRQQELHDAEIKKQAEEALRYKLKLEGDITKESSNLNQQQEHLRTLEAELIVQQDRLERIKKPQFLRSRSEREDEIREQVLLIKDIEQSIVDQKTIIASLKQKGSSLKQELKGLGS